MTGAIVIYCSVTGLLFLGLWLYYDRRDHTRFELKRRRTTFHCIRCDRIYEVAGEVELCRCPRCDHENARLKF